MATDHPKPHPDRLTIAELAGAALRHAGWQTPTGTAYDNAIAELQDIAGDRTDLIAEQAAAALSAEADDLTHTQHWIAGHLLLAAAGLTEDDPDVQRQVAERRARRVLLPRAGSRPGID